MDLNRYGEVLEYQEPKARLRIARGEVPRVLTSILGRYSVQDVAVEDPPLEQVIAELFTQVNVAEAI